MKHGELALLMKGAAPAIMELVTELMKPLAEEVKQLREALASADRMIVELRAAQPEILRAVVAEEVAKLPPAEPGKDADEERITENLKGFLSETVSQAEAAIKAGIGPAVSEAVGRAVAELPGPKKGDPGKDVDMEDVGRRIEEAVEKRFETIRQPEDGKSLTVEEVAPLLADLVAKAVAALPVAKDGRGLSRLLIDRAGVLVATYSDGEAQEVGLIVGKDADMPAILAEVKRLVDEIPRPKDGVDAVGFDEMDLVESEEGVFLRFIKGENVKEFRLPVIVDRGVYREGRTYHKGDGVTWAGSFWIAQEETNDKPDSGKGFRLAVKKGRDGKDAASKPAPVKA